ncbi:restriction endonuclease subunit S [Pontibacter pamirensis]|uniref:restriction endonuclease subunit S n=1 Tax=Pontibacter pamirensis TaxID=2562824 RepID=UPI00192E6256|nr:restriction endonuclease subunit S [Pontibacter pamirensis]
MSDTRIMNKVLKGVEVEWKTLGEVGEFVRGKRFVKTDIISEGFPCIHYGEMYTHYNIWAKEAKSFIDKDLASKLRVANHGDVIIVAAGETIEDIGIGTAWLGDTNVVIHDACFSYKSTLNPKYVSYFLRTKFFHEQIKKRISSGKISAINANGLSKAKIPIPPLDTQAEIVRILDEFTTDITHLKVELKTELSTRKKQYNFYRDQLLTFKEGKVDWKSLGEVGELIRGNGLQKKDFTETGVPAIHYGQIYTYYGICATETKSFVSPELAKTLRKVDTGDVVITNTSENLEDVGKAMVYLGEVQAVTGGHATIFKPSKIILGKYFAYFTQTTAFTNQKRKYAKGTKVIDVSATDMAKINIPIPPLAEQERIVSNLDKFNALTNSINECLPREIRLRQQQYEYYRDLLLSFLKVEIEA